MKTSPHLKHPFGDPLDECGLALGEADVGDHFVLQIPGNNPDDTEAVHVYSLEVGRHTEVLEAARAWPRQPRPVLRRADGRGRPAQLQRPTVIEDTSWSRVSIKTAFSAQNGYFSTHNHFSVAEGRVITLCIYVGHVRTLDKKDFTSPCCT